MTENFDKAMNFIFFVEKEISNEPGDPGGYSVWGISSKYFPDTVTTLKNLTYAESKKLAKNFYYRNFWQKVDGNNLPDKIDAVIMDCAVNQGIDFALRVLRDHSDWRDMLIARLNRYDDLSGKFIKGWCKRLVSMWKYIKSDYIYLKWE